MSKMFTQVVQRVQSGVEIHAIIRLTTSFCEVPAFEAGVEQFEFINMDKQNYLP